MWSSAAPNLGSVSRCCVVRLGELSAAVMILKSPRNYYGYDNTVATTQMFSNAYCNILLNLP